MVEQWSQVNGARSHGIEKPGLGPLDGCKNLQELWQLVDRMTDRSWAIGMVGSQESWLHGGWGVRRLWVSSPLPREVWSQDRTPQLGLMESPSSPGQCYVCPGYFPQDLFIITAVVSFPLSCLCFLPYVTDHLSLESQILMVPIDDHAHTLCKSTCLVVISLGSHPHTG